MTQNKSMAVGRFTVSPNTRPDGDGRYAASVSIRSGNGSASTDRVWRFAERFASPESALRFAARQGIDWARGN